MNTAKIMNISIESKLFVHEFSYVHKLWTRKVLWTKTDPTKNAEVDVDHLRNDWRDHENPGPGNHTANPCSVVGNHCPSTRQAQSVPNWPFREPPPLLLPEGLLSIPICHLHCIVQQCRWSIGTTLRCTFLARRSGCQFQKAVLLEEAGRCIACGQCFPLGLGFGLQ